nr:MAG TPA: hypothetical protein [Caudoviricetes sp.]
MYQFLPSLLPFLIQNLRLAVSLLVHRRTMYNLFTENRHTFRIKYPMLRADTVIAMPTGHRFTSFLMPIPMS